MIPIALRRPTPRKSREPLIITLALARDITARERLETQLRRPRKMKTIGPLNGAAHDFNDLLAAITGNAEPGRRRPAGSLLPPSYTTRGRTFSHRSCRDRIISGDGI